MEWLYADKIKTDKWGIFLYPFARVCPPNMAGVYKSRFVNSYARVLSLPILFSSISKKIETIVLSIRVRPFGNFI